MRLSLARERQVELAIRRNPVDCVVFAATVYVRDDGAVAVHRDGMQEHLHRRLYRLVRNDQLGRRHLVQTCTSFGCVNPFHYEEVGTASPFRVVGPGSANAAKTHCPRGHEYTEANTYYWASAAGVRRRCRACARERRGGIEVA